MGAAFGGCGNTFEIDGTALTAEFKYKKNQKIENILLVVCVCLSECGLGLGSQSRPDASPSSQKAGLCQ